VEVQRLVAHIAIVVAGPARITQIAQTVAEVQVVPPEAAPAQYSQTFESQSRAITR
jgi:nitrate reductase assembly molybdenum cofactor insertion protein NarJ